jgi:hypothetical protein
MKTIIYGICGMALSCVAFVVGTAFIMHLQDEHDKQQLEALKLEACDSPMWVLVANVNGEIWVESETVDSITEIAPNGEVWVNETHVVEHNEYAKQFYKCALGAQLMRYRDSN